MQLLNPIWLWALTGLSIPLAIHLLSRKEGKVIRFGSLRHLRNAKTTRFKSVRLNEVLLLWMRALLILAIVLFLAGIYFPFGDQKAKKWLVIEKGLEHHQALQTLLNNQASTFERRYLTAGFPMLKDSARSSAPDNYYALIKALVQEPVDTVVIVSYSYLKNFKGERVNLPPHITWITMEDQPSVFTARTVRLSYDSLWARKGISNETSTAYHSQWLRLSETEAVTADPDTVRISIVYEPGFEYDLAIVTASIKAIQSVVPDKLLTTPVQAGQSKAHALPSDWTIYLTQSVTVDKPAAKSIGYVSCAPAQTPLLMQPDERICSLEVPYDWLITKRLTESKALEENLTLRLADIILPKPEAIINEDKRRMPEQWMWTRTASLPHQPPQKAQEEPEPYWIVLILILLMSERLVAFRRNQ